MSAEMEVKKRPLVVADGVHAGDRGDGPVFSQSNDLAAQGKRVLLLARSNEQRRRQGILDEDISDFVTSGWYLAGTWAITGEQKDGDIEPRTPLFQGGFGAVYKAWDTKLNGPCAIKESFETVDEAARKQFDREHRRKMTRRNWGSGPEWTRGAASYAERKQVA